MTIADYQWPIAAALPGSFHPVSLPGTRRSALERQIEAFFEERLGGYAVLMPSARAALSMILRSHGINRSHVVHVPKWISHCLWDVVGRYANPSVSFDRPDVVLPVHKWANISRTGPASGALVIEDSVDSLIEDRRSLFPNNGLYELFSLPKILGTYCGGIALTRDTALAARLHETKVLKLVRKPGFERRQSWLKWSSTKTVGALNMEWEYWEFASTRLDPTALVHIEGALGNYARNAATIVQRRSQVRAACPEFDDYWPRSGRLPPVLPVPCRLFASTNIPLLIRRHDFTGNTRSPRFEPAYLLPLHMGIDDAHFKKLFTALHRLPKVAR